MEDEDGRDLVPVRDVTIDYFKQHVVNAEEKGHGYNFISKMVSKWPREQLEDKYFSLAEENLILKKHNVKQEEKIKKMTTKLVRLVNDKKKQERSTQINVGAKKRDIETQQLIEDLEDRIQALQRENKSLSDKVVLFGQQLATQLKKPVFGPYRPASYRMDRTKTLIKPTATSSSANGRIASNATYNHCLLEKNDQKVENPQIINLIPDESQNQIKAYQQQLVTVQNQMEMAKQEYEDEIITLKSQLSQEQKQILQDNVSTIKLQREVKHKTSQIAFLEKTCHDLEDRLNLNNRQQEQYTKKLEAVNQKLQQANTTINNLKEQNNTFATTNVVIIELKEKISDLEKENKILRDSNERLIESAINVDKVRVQFPNTERVDSKAFSEIYLSKQRNSELEQLNREITDQLEMEKKNQVKLKNELDELREQIEKMKNQNLSQQANVPELRLQTNIDDLEKAMLNFYQEAENNLHLQLDIKREEDNFESLKLKLKKEQSNHAETIHELEQTKNMLTLQHQINKDYQLEIDAFSDKIIHMKKDFETQLLLKTQELHVKSLKIEALEQQLLQITAFKSAVPKQTEAVTNNQPLTSYNDNISLKGNENIIYVTIISCKNLQNQKNNDSHSLNSYCVYTFNNVVHHTDTVHNSNFPQFNDQRKFKVEVNGTLDQLLQNEPLEVFIFNNDVSGIVSSLGVATIPLEPLTQNQPIQGEFQLLNDGVTNGSIEVHLYWQLPYSFFRQPLIVEEPVKGVALPVAQNLPTPKPRTLKGTNQKAEDVNDTIVTEPLIITLPNSKKTDNCFSSGSSCASGGEEDNDSAKAESDSEVVISKPDLPSKPSQIEQVEFPKVTLTVLHLKLKSKSTVMKNPFVNLLFVEYRFLDFPAGELETPFSLPKSSKQKLFFNFTKVFHLDLDKQKQLVQWMSSLSKPIIHFTIVSEPPEDKEDVDCEDVGTASVDLTKVQKNGKDIVRQNIDGTGNYNI